MKKVKENKRKGIAAEFADSANYFNYSFNHSLFFCLQFEKVNAGQHVLCPSVSGSEGFCAVRVFPFSAEIIAVFEMCDGINNRNLRVYKERIVPILLQFFDYNY